MSGFLVTGLVKRASTGASGYTLVNGTGTVLTWTAPLDGQLHTVYLASSLRITSAATGGQFNITVNDTIAGAGYSPVVFNASKGAGYFIQVDTTPLIVLTPGDTIAIVQQTALTAGAGSLFAEIWAS